MTKWGILLGIMVLIGVPAFGNGEGEPADQPAAMRLGHVVSRTHPWHLAALKFAAAVSENTQGAVRIDVYCEGRLGGEKELLEDLRRGIIELAVLGSGTASQMDPRLNVLLLPFLFRDRSHFRAVVNGPIGEELLGGLADAIRVRGLAFWERGPRCLTNSKRPINGLEDLSGLRIRVPVEELAIETWKALGAVPVPIAFEKVFIALKQGLVDGQENPLSTIASSGFFEIQKHLALTGHVIAPALFAMSEMKFSRLSPEFQEIFRAAAKNAAAFVAEAVEKEDDSLIAAARERGVAVTRPDKSPFVEALRKVNDRYISIAGRELYGKIINVR